MIGPGQELGVEVEKVRTTWELSGTSGKSENTDRLQVWEDLSSAWDTLMWKMLAEPSLVLPPGELAM